MKIRYRTIAGGLVGVFALAALAACSGEPKSSSKPSAATPAAPAKPAAAAKPMGNPGSVAGTVRFEGAAPPVRSIRMDADPYCAQANQDGAHRRDVVVGEGGGLDAVFVYVKSGVTGEHAPSSTPAVLDQSGCQYSPKTVGVQVDQPLEIRNSDKTLHNVHALPKNSKGFNMAMPNQGMKSTKKFSAAEVLVRIKCDVHPWMETFVGVVDHPFFDVTGTDGAFEISGLPAGDYEIEAVHPKLGAKSAKVTVPAGGKASADFSLSK